MNQTSRRSFVLTSGMASGAALFGSIGSVFAAAPVASVGTLVSQYGTKVSSRRLGDQSVEYRVKVRDFSAFAETFGNQGRLSWDRVEALEGNVLKLTGGGRTVVLKHI